MLRLQEHTHTHTHRDWIQTQVSTIASRNSFSTYLHILVQGILIHRHTHTVRQELSRWLTPRTRWQRWSGWWCLSDCSWKNISLCSRGYHSFAKAAPAQKNMCINKIGPKITKIGWIFFQFCKKKFGAQNNVVGFIRCIILINTNKRHFCFSSQKQKETCIMWILDSPQSPIFNEPSLYLAFR